MVVDLISGNFKGLFAVKSVSIDDGWDQMNRNYMVMFCIMSGTIMTLRQNLGTIINCVGDAARETGFNFANDNDAFVTDYCSAQGLFTLKEAYSLSWPDEVPYPGITPLKGLACLPGYFLKNGTPIECPDPEDVKPFTHVYHIWYMFVPFYFCAAGVAFFFPYTIFRHLSGIYDIKPMLKTLTCDIEPYTEEDLARKVDNVSRWLYIKLDPFMNNEQPYTQIVHKHSLFYTVMVVKLLYLLVSFLVFYGTDHVFEQGDFATYGYDVLKSMPTGLSYQIMDILFPKMVACEIRIWGTTGLRTESLLCVLPQNIGNQYFFLMFWMLLITVICTNILSILITTFRFVFVAGSYKRFLRISLLKDHQRYHKVYTHIGTTGRYILLLCAQHSNPKVFEDLMEIICSLLIANYHKRTEQGRITNKEVRGKGRTSKKSDFSKTPV